MNVEFPLMIWGLLPHTVSPRTLERGGMQEVVISIVTMNPLK